MMVELPEELGEVLKAHAKAHGVSPDGYVREVLERDLASSLEAQSAGMPFKTGRGIFAKYSKAPSAEEIDANRADMFRNFGEDFWLLPPVPLPIAPRIHQYQPRQAYPLHACLEDDLVVGDRQQLPPDLRPRLLVMNY